MHSKSKRYVIIFNGEIYNHLELRSLLQNHDWKSSSDTETLLSCIEKWGIQRTLYKIRGMFAFALWDKKDKLLYLARDRAGEKPLYYGFINNLFVLLQKLKLLNSYQNGIIKLIEMF